MNYTFWKSRNMELFSLNTEFDSKLSVVELGYNRREDYGSGKPLVAKAHQIHFVVEGSGGIDGIQVKVHQGFYVPSGSVYLESSNTNGIEQCWINISGSESEQLLNEMGISTENRIFDFHHTAPQIISSIKEVFTLREYDIDKYSMLSLFYKLMSYIIKSKNAVTEIQNKYILEAEEYVRRHYAEGITVSTIAAELNLSTKYLSRIYSETRGTTLISYITATRMNSAKLLLRHTNDSISSIARECGYNDPLYFSKAFRRYYMITPSEYRAIP